MKEKLQKKWGVVGCGWLGLSLADQLVHEGIQVHGSTRSAEKAEAKSKSGLIMHVYDASKEGSKAEWLNEIDVVVINIPPSQMNDYPNDLLSIVQQLNDYCCVVFVSSTSVYPNTNSSVDEHAPTNGTNRNGPTVSEAEQALRQFLGTRLTILRMSGLVGRDRHPVKYMAGKEVSGGYDPINLVHREDCVNVILNVAEKEAWGEVFNVCCSDHPEKKEYYEYAAKQLNVPSPIFEEKRTHFKIIENDRLKNKLGYQYKYDSPYDFPL